MQISNEGDLTLPLTPPVPQFNWADLASLLTKVRSDSRKISFARVIQSNKSSHFSLKLESEVAVPCQPITNVLKMQKETGFTNHDWQDRVRVESIEMLQCFSPGGADRYHVPCMRDFARRKHLHQGYPGMGGKHLGCPFRGAENTPRQRTRVYNLPRLQISEMRTRSPVVLFCLHHWQFCKVTVDSVLQLSQPRISRPAHCRLYSIYPLWSVFISLSMVFFFFLLWIKLT